METGNQPLAQIKIRVYRAATGKWEDEPAGVWSKIIAAVKQLTAKINMSVQR